eukprot:TRINITY_DN37477_c0_g1_i1.p1 TRINITY_DN37477_c0_g1~~TRINITY_DN37477_c0_g1_i1.p1  ORF type:complete len:1020 (-),score=217.40 TRINITY_DN37477_c0_g1_i1:185-2911(-)
MAVLAVAAALRRRAPLPSRRHRRARNCFRRYLEGYGAEAATLHPRRQRPGCTALRASKFDKAVEQSPDEYDVSPETLGEPPDITFMLEEKPARSSSSLIVQHRLGSESQYQAVLKLVEQYLPKFDIFNIATALHKCGLSARDDDLIARQIQSDPNFILLFSAAKKEILASVSDTDPHVLSTVLWACARLSVFDSELTSAVAVDASQRMHYYSPASIGHLLFALGFSGVRPRPTFIAALVTELRGRNDFETNDLTLIVYGCMRLGIRDERVMRVVSDHITRSQLEDAEPLSVVSLCYAYAKLDYWDKRVMAVLGSRVSDCMDSFSPRMFSMAALCFSAGAQFLEDSDYAMERMKKSIEARLEEFTHRDLSTIAFAYGKFAAQQTQRKIAMGELPRESGRRNKFMSNDKSIATLVEEDPLITALKKEVLRRDHESFTMTELNLIVYALMRMDNRDDKFLEVSAELLRKNAAELMLIEIVNVVYCFGRSNFLHVGLLQAMIEELKRRNCFDEFEPLHFATLVYGMAMQSARQEDILDRAAAHLCARIREYQATAVNMLVYGLACLNCRNHGEAVVSAVSEDMVKNPDKYDISTTCSLMFSFAILSGPTAGLWTMQTLFKPSFWESERENQSYTMVYYMLAAMQAELGLPTEDLVGWNTCRTAYEVMTSLHMGQQHKRLSDRLRIQMIPHEANTMAPALEGYPEAGVRVDVAIPKLRLIIEVEGPQRSTIPLDKLIDKLNEEDQQMAPGEVAEVLSQAKEYVECGLTGPAAFKRRLLRKCGWRVVTVSFDESEEYIADALKKMINKDGDSEAEEDTTTAARQLIAENYDYITSEDAENISLPRPDAANISEFELKLRAEHEKAMQDLKVRIMQERGNAAGSATFSDHLEYRKWQVKLEKSILKDMVAQVTAA